MSEQLKPCPFCGSKRIKAYDVGEGWWCICQHCKAHGPFQMLENTAVDAWNRRAEVKGDNGLSNAQNIAFLVKCGVIPLKTAKILAINSGCLSELRRELHLKDEVKNDARDQV